MLRNSATRSRAARPIDSARPAARPDPRSPRPHTSGSRGGNRRPFFGASPRQRRRPAYYAVRPAPSSPSTPRRSATSEVLAVANNGETGPGNLVTRADRGADAVWAALVHTPVRASHESQTNIPIDAARATAGLRRASPAVRMGADRGNPEYRPSRRRLLGEGLRENAGQTGRRSFWGERRRVTGRPCDQPGELEAASVSLVRPPRLPPLCQPRRGGSMRSMGLGIHRDFREMAI